MANATLSLSTSLTDRTKNNKIQSPPLTRTRLGGQGGQGDKGEKQYKVCIFSKKNSPLKDHCP
ncbi:hypothetical protein, partial [Anabaena sp. CS-542/02]|uniref:hypothetical protein n=1 Tax=Anabaena sp. CS-542/02 TaxID=3021719 RepID=UPI00232E741C